jgi:hypothetical protein
MVSKVRMRQYGVSEQKYQEMLIKQEGVCGICRLATKHRLCVDHEHRTGKIRGLLCKPCNVALGNMEDSPLRLRAAADYVERFNLTGQLPITRGILNKELIQ